MPCIRSRCRKKNFQSSFLTRYILLNLKLLFDNNLSAKLTEVIQPYFPESKHVVDLGISHFDDKEIWEFAKEGSYSIVTKDRDFYYMATTLGQVIRRKLSGLLWQLQKQNDFRTFIKKHQ